MSDGRRRRRRVGWSALGACGVLAVLAAPVHGQDLADFDYEHLSFRGIGLDLGWIMPTRVEPDLSLGVRVDMGYLGPGVRILPTVGYWSSRMKTGEVRGLERRLNELIDSRGPVGSPPADVDLGRIDWSDLVLGLDAQVVWSVPFGLLTYAGAGAAAHIMNGEGAAIRETFVEDLLDTVTAGFNLHTGIELPMGDRFRFYGTLRYELLNDLSYGQIRLGSQIMFGPAAPGEVSR